MVFRKRETNSLNHFFLLSSFGQLAYSTLELWKTFSILFVLIVLITYILNKRMGPTLFEAVEEKEGIDQLLEANELVSSFQSRSHSVHIPIENDESIDVLDVSKNNEIDKIERSTSFEIKNDEIRIYESIENDEIEHAASFENELLENIQEDHLIAIRNSEINEETIPSANEEKGNLF